jgi:N-acetyl-gamma-glutamyl-phosphate reductase
MRPKVYIDGHVGTTGLRIREWMAGREDVEMLEIPERHRKDGAARREHVLAADLTVLCLPDDASREAAGWAAEAMGSNRAPRLLDASTAHRVAPDWVYGLPELGPGQREAIRSAALVANPGCYPSAFVLLTRPLVDAGLLAPSAPLSIHALSGYSGGGRALIERWEDPGLALRSLPFEAPYALDRVHKHIPEMTAYSGLEHPPQFVPAMPNHDATTRIRIAAISRPKP